MAAKKAQTPKKSDKPDPALKQLDVLVGKWVTEWRLKQGSPDKSFHIIGTDTYEWLPGEFFLLHHVDVRMSGLPYQVTEIIGGYDHATHTYPMHSFDSRGNLQVMQALVGDKGVWTFAGENARATLVVNKDGETMQASWEQTKDGAKWVPWMDMKFTKVR